MLNEEEKYYELGFKFIVGCDEAGRGPLCGPVVAAACILPISFNDELINDSKKLTEKKRNEAFKLIKDNAIAYGIGVVNATEIDKINIYEASRKAMLLALKNMNHDVDIIFTDCMPLTFNGIKANSIVKGDARFKNIAAASILAKVTRDMLMDDYDKLYPQYDLKHNLIKRWNSMTKASKDLNIPLHYISCCCNGERMTTKGYIFEFGDKEVSE